MYCGTLDNTHLLVRLEKGEDIPSSLKQIAKNHNVTNASITGIGSVENPTLAHYRMDTRKYHEEKKEGIFEVLSLLGNIMQENGEALVHIHMTISDEHMQAMGGHVVSATTSATMEIFLTLYPSTFGKKADEEVGLKLLDLPICKKN